MQFEDGAWPLTTAFICVGRGKSLSSNSSPPHSKTEHFYYVCFFKGCNVVAILIFFSSFTFLLLLLFSSRNEHRKTALLNLLSVKGLLGIFSMWRKIRKSPRNFCQLLKPETLPTLSWVLSVLIKDAMVAALWLQKRYQVEPGQKGPIVGSPRLLPNISYPILAIKEAKVWKEAGVQPSSSQQDGCQVEGCLFLCIPCKSWVVRAQKLRGLY